MALRGSEQRWRLQKFAAAVQVALLFFHLAYLHADFRGHGCPVVELQTGGSGAGIETSAATALITEAAAATSVTSETAGWGGGASGASGAQGSGASGASGAAQGVPPRVFDDPERAREYFTTPEDGEWFASVYRQQGKRRRVALMSTGTGKYASFLPRMVDSAERLLLLHHNVDYHLFTDYPRSELPPYLATHPRVYIHRVAHAGWPQSTGNRFNHYAGYCSGADATIEPPPGVEVPPAEVYDYMVAIDADAAFVDFVGEELLADWFTTMHIENGHLNGSEVGGFTGPWAARRENVDRPGLWHNHGAFLDAGHVEAWDNAPPLQTYDPNLKDYVGWYRHYYYGGFYGGRYDRFCFSVSTMAEWMAADGAAGHRAPHDDETYINALNFRYPPSRVLTTAYMHPDIRLSAPNHPWAWDYFAEERQHDKYPAKVLNVAKDRDALLS